MEGVRMRRRRIDPSEAESSLRQLVTKRASTAQSVDYTLKIAVGTVLTIIPTLVKSKFDLVMKIEIGSLIVLPILILASRYFVRRYREYVDVAMALKYGRLFDAISRDK